MNVVGALVRVDRFEVAHVAHHMEFVRYAVAPMHVACCPRDIKGFSGTVSFDQGNHFGLGRVGFEQSPDL